MKGSIKTENLLLKTPLQTFKNSIPLAKEKLIEYNELKSAFQSAR